MRVLKKRLLFLTLMGVFILITAQSALALLKSGSVEYDVGTLNGTIYYAVFESPDAFNTAWGSAGLSAPGDGQYVYAYIIENNIGSTDVSYFALFGLDENNTSGIGFGDDGGGGIKPFSAQLDSTETKGIWEWAEDDTHSYLNPEKSSWMLYFSSDQGPVKGEYEIRGPEDDGPYVPGAGNVPEPSMIALIGVGGSVLFRRRKVVKS